MRTERSQELFERAQRVIPGGVNSPVRAFRAVGGHPRFIASGEGAWLTDVDGNRLLDCVGSWGPLIFGHAHPRIVEAVRRQAGLGSTFGAPTELEVAMAEAIHAAVPSMEQVRLVSSGTEATMSAIRVARGFTGRSKVVKFEGCYHGHADHLLAKSGSGVATFGMPDSAGVPESVTACTVTIPYNDLTALEAAFAADDAGIACVIVEPVAGNMGVVPPRPGFLTGLREITRRYGTLLIFDEVITGFRLGRGGAQGRYGVVPDLTTLGKIIGGGLPIGAYGGRADVMAQVSPLGPVYQAGTLSGNPLAVAAGLETLRMIEEDAELYTRLDQLGSQAADGLREAAAQAGVPATVNQVGSMLTLFFGEQEVDSYICARMCDTNGFARFHRHMLERSVYLPPSQFEAAFMSDAMSDAEVELLVSAASESLKAA